MLTWISRIAGVAGCLLAVIGLLAYPAVVWISAFLALLVGSITAMHASSAHPDTRTTPRAVATNAGATAAASLIAAGIIALLGPVAALVIPLLLAAAGTWAWQHRQKRCDHGHRHTAAPHPAPGPDAHRRTPRRVTTQPPKLPRIHIDQASTAELRAAWQRSYWVLQDLPPGPARCEVVDIRHSLLDELECRDPDGFHRWLQTDPRAGSDPGRYPTADH